MYKSFVLALFALCIVNALADVAHLVQRNAIGTTTTTPEPYAPPSPYVFSYQAGRAPGHVDRQHTEVSDGTGVIRGAFSYIDPKQELRTVQYVADENGFHPELSHQQEDTEAVKKAKRKHFNLYNRIAEQNNKAPEEITYAAAPKNSAAVNEATKKHLSLYEKIASEHAAIGAEHEAQRLALEAYENQAEQSE